MLAVCGVRALHLLEFMDRRALPNELKRLRQTTGYYSFARTCVHEQLEGELRGYFSGESALFQKPLALHGSVFALNVWQALQAIPMGKTQSYSNIATAVGPSSATRAVARANGANQIALLVPCHRVSGRDGTPYWVWRGIVAETEIDRTRTQAAQ